MYQVLARKWRPQTFAELVGQRHVADTLSNAVESDRLAHAYIFAGLRGTGKTSVARILAKCLNCRTGPRVTPCDECESCREIVVSQSMDVLEIDAASRTKVEQTRELLEIVSYAPVRDRYKILIIDEAHMLSKASFNALLKTLEEPPPNVLFVLATTELQKVLPTILSRCQVFEFRRVTAKETAAHLRRICEREEIRVSDASIDRIARAGEGSVRDSLSVLERVLAFCGNEVEDDDVLRLLGAVRAETLTAMTRAVAERNASGMIAVLDSVVDEGHDLVHFWSELIAVLRDLMLLRAAPDKGDLLARSEGEARQLTEAAGDLSLEDLSRVFQALADLEPALKASARPRYLFEAALIRIASFGAVRPIEEVLAGLGPGPVGPPSGSAPSPGRKPGPAGRGGKAKDSRQTAPAPAPAPSAPEGSFGTRLLEAARAKRPMLGALLDEATLRREGDTLVVAFPGNKSVLRRQLERRENREALVRLAGELAGAEIDVLISASDEEPHAEPEVRTPGARPTEKTPAGGGGSRRDERDRPGRQRLMQQARGESGVKRLLTEFGAQVVDVRAIESRRDAETPGEGSAEGLEDLG